MKTDEDDEFDRIEREKEMRKGQPYHWEADAIKAAVLIEREACARVVDHILKEGGGTWGDAIRARGNT